MRATIHRPMSFTLGLCLSTIGPLSYAQEREREPESTLMELGATEILADGLGSLTEGTGSYTTGETSAATRLNLSIKDTPQSVSVVTRQQLDDFHLDTLSDAMAQVAGVTVQRNDSERPTYFARGYAIDNFQVDGMLNTFSGVKSDSDTVIYDRIEVVRGATGLTTGAGDPSGTIAMYRKRPTHQWAVKTGLSAGSYDNYRGYLDIGGPLAWDGRLRGRTVLAYRDSQSFMDTYASQREVAYGILEADLTSSTTLTLGYQDQNNVPKGAIWGTIPRFASDGSLAGLPRETSFSPSWARWSRQNGTFYAQLEQKLGDDWTLKAIANHSEGNTFRLTTYASGYASPTTGAGLRLLAAVGKSWDRRDSLDLYASGTVELFGRKHDLVIGANGVKTTTVTPTLTGVANWSYAIPDIRTWDGSAPAPTYTATGAKRVAETEQSGIFAMGRWKLMEPLALVTGARLSQWKTGTDAYSTTGAFTGRSGNFKVTDEVSPYVGVVYDVTDAVSLYASYTDLFKPQNYKDKNDQLLAPIRGSNTEVGIKGEFLDKRLAVSAAIFEAKQDNFAVRDSSVGEGTLPDGSSAYIGVNGTKTKGFEVDIGGQLAPGWTINAGYANTRITRNALDLIYANLPRHTLQLNTSYRLRGGWERLTVGAGLNAQSAVSGFGIPHPTLGTVTVTQGAFVLLNLNANYQLNERFSLGLSVRNALDKTYWANLDYPNYADPRSVMLNVRGRF